MYDTFIEFMHRLYVSAPLSLHMTVERKLLSLHSSSKKTTKRVHSESENRAKGRKNGSRDFLGKITAAIGGYGEGGREGESVITGAIVITIRGF